MLHPAFTPIPDDTEEAPWMVMGTPQYDAVHTFVQTLRAHAQTRTPPFFVAGMLPIRYHPAPSSDHVEQLAPDVMVAAVPVHARRSYDLDAEGVAPLFVLEVVSPQSKQRDRVIKPQRYERMGVLEYALFDPGELGRGEATLEGYRRDSESEQFVDWESDAAGRLYSERLDVWLVVRGAELRLQRPDGSWVLTYAESEAARDAEQVARLTAELARDAERNARLASESAREASEAEVERLRAELERFRQQ